MDSNRYLKKLTALATLAGLICLQGCLPIFKDNPGGKFGKKNCCDPCESQKKERGSVPATGIPVATAPAQSRVLPDEINSGNYQKILKNLEDEVTLSGPTP